MLPLQNQESVIAHPCRHLGCPKRLFWRTPRDPDFGKDFLGGIIYMYIYIYVYTYMINIFRALLKVNHVAKHVVFAVLLDVTTVKQCLNNLGHAAMPHHPGISHVFRSLGRTFSVVLARYTSHASTSPNSMWTAWHWRYCSPSTLKLKGTTIGH